MLMQRGRIEKGFVFCVGPCNWSGSTNASNSREVFSEMRAVKTHAVLESSTPHSSRVGNSIVIASALIRNPRATCESGEVGSSLGVADDRPKGAKLASTI